VITTTTFRRGLWAGNHGNREDDMSKKGPAAEPAANLTMVEADRRKAILGLLKDALAARRIPSALVGRRTLVLRSAEGAEHGEPVRPSDPQLYVFATGGIRIVTTDGEMYRLTSGDPCPVSDPAAAARAYADWRQ
jgi:hypothetical protein